MKQIEMHSLLLIVLKKIFSFTTLLCPVSLSLGKKFLSCPCYGRSEHFHALVPVNLTRFMTTLNPLVMMVSFVRYYEFCALLFTSMLLLGVLGHIQLFETPCRLPGSSVHGTFQARILEWIAISYSRGSSQSRD